MLTEYLMTVTEEDPSQDTVRTVRTDVCSTAMTTCDVARPQGG